MQSFFYSHRDHLEQWSDHHCNLRARLEQRIRGGILEENNPMERNGVDTFGTQDCFVPCQRKGNCQRTFHRNETIHSKSRERIFAGSLPPTAQNQENKE
jgi:hypothetical protein